jgi:hypothetical protein
MVEKDLTGLLLTDDAGGFLPGEPLSCLGMTSQRLPLWLRSLGTARTDRQARQLDRNCGVPYLRLRYTGAGIHLKEVVPTECKGYWP